MEEALITLKMLLGIEDTKQDVLLNFLIDDTRNLIMGYCRLDFMPRQLESLVPVIAADMYRANGYGQESAPEDIKSVSEGARSVSYESRRPDTDILKSYSARLKPYRNMKGRVPSDVSV